MLRPRPISVLAFCLGCFLAASSLNGAWDAPISLVLGIAIVAIIAHSEGLRSGTDVLDQMTARLVEETEQMNRQTEAIRKADVTFHVSDDGSTHALVTLDDGGMRSIPIPAEHCSSPRAAIQYIALTLGNEMMTLTEVTDDETGEE